MAYIYGGVINTILTIKRRNSTTASCTHVNQSANTAPAQQSERIAAHTSIHNGNTAGNIPRTGRYQESRHIGYILRLAKITQRDLPRGKFTTLFAGEDAADICGVYEARLQAIDPDTMLSQLAGKLLGPNRYACFGNSRRIDGT